MEAEAAADLSGVVRAEGRWEGGAKSEAAAGGEGSGAGGEGSGARMGPADDDDDDDGLSDEFVVVAIRSGDRVRHVRIPREVFDELRRYVVVRRIATYHLPRYRLPLTRYHVPLTCIAYHLPCPTDHVFAYMYMYRVPLTTSTDHLRCRWASCAGAARCSRRMMATTTTMRVTITSRVGGSRRIVGGRFGTSLGPVTTENVLSKLAAC